MFNHSPTYTFLKITPLKKDSLFLTKSFISFSSGPKRYDLTESNCWVYRHNGVSLHKLLSDEISDVTGQPVSFTDLLYGGGTNS